MKIYFDARMIDHPGIGRYIRCLLPLMAEDKSVDLCLLGNRNKIKKLLDIDARIIDFDYPIYSIREQVGYLKLRKEIYKGKMGQSPSPRLRSGQAGTVPIFPILHIPHYNIPVLAKFNLVATVHDLIHIIYPQGASGRLAPMYMKFMIDRILKSAKAVICVSKATRDEIKKMFIQKKRMSCPRKRASISGACLDSRLRGNDSEIIWPAAEPHVIYEGVDKVFVKMTDLEYLKSIKEKYRLSDRFLLYVGSIRRHKNIDALLDSFSQFKKRVPEANLVMVGRLSQGIDIKRDGVVYLGEIESDKELAAIYNLASCLFNLSLYEGFGLTILEAQKCGLPVVCSNIAVHKEIGRDGIAAVEASYIDQVCDNLYNVVSNKEMRESLISRGLKNADRFDWRVTAKDTIDLYRRICNEGSDSSRLASGDARRRKDSQCLL
jgi:glycosyltransferase involved in cell wall biosynthesis